MRTGESLLSMVHLRKQNIGAELPAFVGGQAKDRPFVYLREIGELRAMIMYGKAS